MLMNLSNKSQMGSPFVFHEFKKQAYSFFKDKVKTARLALTDVTPVQLMTEDATNGNIWPPDTRAIGVISRAAFEVDDYWRIVEILHARLVNFDRRDWRGSYKALILLEHLLTHGPLRIADEFNENTHVIKEIESFQYIDEKGFNWGLRVNKLSKRVLQLIEDLGFLREERARARKLTRGIEGFGSFIQHPSSGDAAMKDFPSKVYGRCNSQYNTHQKEGDEFFGQYEICETQPNGEEIVYKTREKFSSGSWLTRDDENSKDNHPFCDDENQTTEFLLSSEQLSAKEKQF